MAFRIAAAQISHETNVFSAVKTDFDAFLRSGLATEPAVIVRERGTNSAFGGFFAGAEEQGFDLHPIASVWATPSGMVTAAAFDQLAQILVDGLRAASPVDGVLLALHGAMVSERELDADGALIEIARREVGPDVPIVCTLDLHANISQRMVAKADLLIGYETYPHVDMADRARDAAAKLNEILNGAIHPVAALRKPPMLPTSQRMTTDRDPMRALIAMARAAMSDPRVVNITVAGGFPPADVEEAGFSVLVTIDNDPKHAAQIADSIASAAWGRRAGFLGGVSTFDEAAAAIAARSSSEKPLVLVDIGDNPWTGGPGDSVEIVRFLLEHGVSNAAVALVSDADSVRKCIEAGAGAQIELVLGAKTDRLHGEPIALNARVLLISDGRYVNDGPMMAGLTVDLGPSVVIETGEAQLNILVTSRAETPIDLNIFRRHGIEPKELDVIGLKGKGHFRAAFEPISSGVILVEGPGITGADLSRLPFRRIRRPIWPLDPETEWNPASNAG